MTKTSMHRSLTLGRVQEAARRQQRTLDNPGFCVDCGHEQDGCEPDGREINCEHCGHDKVYGADELVLMILDFQGAD